MTAFTSDFFKGNRARLRTVVDDELIVVTANGLLQRSGDATFPFHQDPNFWYLTGLDEPDLLLAMDGSDEYLIVPKRSHYLEVFDGKFENKAFTAASGIKTILPQEAGWQRLEAALKKYKRVATPMAADPYLDVYGMYVNPARAALAAQLTDSKARLKLADIRHELAYMRMVKQKVELTAIQNSIDLTLEALSATKRHIAKLNYEYELEAKISEHFLAHGADNAWKPIVAAGANACTIHHRNNNDRLRKNDLVLLDIGAQLNHYPADITRTYSIGGKPTARQQAVHTAVLDVQEYAMSLLRPGVTIRDYEKQIENYMGKKLRELKLIKSIKREAVRKYFPHATSHFLGLDPHDAGDYDRPLEPNAVLTVEPGIYIPQERIGVRIEDDLIITKTGCKVLSADLSRNLT